MLKIINHIGTTNGTQEKHLKFPIDVDVRGSYKDHLIVRVDTGADVNCMNETTFRKLFPKVQLDVCPYKIQNQLYRPSTTFMTGTIQPKSHEKASKNTIGTVNIDNMSTSKNPTPCRTM